MLELKNIPGAQCCRMCYSEDDIADTVASFFTRNVFEEEAVEMTHKGNNLDLEEREDVKLGSDANYKGQWRGQARHGYGVLTTLDGNCYEGFFCC